MQKSSIIENHNTQALIDSMVSGNAEAIIIGIQSEIPILIMNAILQGAKHCITDSSFIRALQEKHVNSDVVLLGVRIGSCAIAALDYLNIKKYKGDDQFITGLIETKFQYV